MEVRDLETELRQNAPFPIAEAVDVVVELAEVLARTHELGAVNGRVCTANIIVHRGTFGSARLRPASQGTVSTRTNQSLRSHLYLSPEQLADSPELEPATDIWSLAVVLYELIAGKAPFPNADAIKRVVFPPLRSVRQCPAQLEMAITSCLQQNPFGRTQSVVSFALNIAPFGSSRSKSLIPKLKAMEPPASDPTMHAASDSESELTQPRLDRPSDATMQKGGPDAPTMPPRSDARHPADQEGDTLMVPSLARGGETTEVEAFLEADDEEPDTFVKPTVPVGFSPLGQPILPAAITPPPSHARKAPLNEKTQRISSSQLQELGKHVTAVRARQASQSNLQVETAPRLSAPSSPELGTPISNIRMRDGAGLAPAELPQQLAAMQQTKRSRLPAIVSVLSLAVFIACVVAAAMILLTNRR